ncbi:Mu transposase C-terminal domain-containing protein [Streptomyces sp. NPDC002659]|uniref:Mu transposase C-terminal domain-containing protein n=1 Tax=Streptomyces sp. NPDC002659 TaxID=3364656 RepID=UPI0036956B28
MPATPPPSGPYDTTSLRDASVQRLLRLRENDRLTLSHLRTVAEAFEVHWRTVRRWMDNADAHDGTYTPMVRRHFTLTPAMHDALTRWCGNVTAAYRELTDDGLLGIPPRVVALATFHRAVHRELSPGQRAALRGGEKARRRHDVHGQRPPGFRNDVWEADHVEASLWVNVEGHPSKPWITWFIDHATAVICGVAITPHTPSREAILAAVRDAVLCGGHHRPFGGIPIRVRVDRGRDFLSTAVDTALKAFGTELIILPPYSPYLKGTVESLNAAVKHMLFKGLPGYTHAPASRRDKRGTVTWNLDELLHYEAFVTRVLQWVEWWNHEHPIARLHRRTPAQAWEADLTPIDTVDPIALHTYTLERHGKPLTITSKGVQWKGGYYVGDWMHGHGSAGEQVHLRHEPHHYHQVELYHATTGHYLGPATRANEMTPQQARQLRQAWQREADHFAAKRDKARKNARARYAATSTPAPPRHLNRLTAEEAAAQLRDLQAGDLAAEARPDLLPRPQPSSGRWTKPLTQPKTTGQDNTEPPAQENP